MKAISLNFALALICSLALGAGVIYVSPEAHLAGGGGCSTDCGEGDTVSAGGGIFEVDEIKIFSTSRLIYIEEVSAAAPNGREASRRSAANTVYTSNFGSFQHVGVSVGHSSGSTWYSCYAGSCSRDN